MARQRLTRRAEHGACPKARFSLAMALEWFAASSRLALRERPELKSTLA
ncbi:MAG: hypothetical protein ACYDGN_16845 [Acidimicrobiales bacterium]